MLNERIDSAIEILWVTPDFSKGAEAIKILEEEIAAGNGDAYFFLARCYAGPCFVSSSFGFEENDDKVEQLLNKGLEAGSAVTMFGARRFGGFKPVGGTFIHPPFATDKEIWDEIVKMSNEGHVFITYLVANAYYYGDVIEFFGMDFESLPKEEAFVHLYAWLDIAEQLYEDCISKGCTLGVPNYINMLTSGDYGRPKNEKRANEIEEIAAGYGMGRYELSVGKRIMKDEPERAKELFERAVEHDYEEGYYYLGEMCDRTSNHPDLPKSIEYMNKGIEKGKMVSACYNKLGEAYFYGGEGVEKDYERAFEYLKKAASMDNKWGYDMLGMCYIMGIGGEADYEQAREKLLVYPNERLSRIGLGMIYAYGLGVPANIKKGMEYWDKIPNDPEVIAHKQNFKKTLFGWKRIK